MPTPPPLKLRLPLAQPPAEGTAASLPAVLVQPAARGEAGVTALLPNVRAVRSWSLAPASRSSEAPLPGEAEADSRLLAIEASDGTTLFIRADVLAERIAQVQPAALGSDGAVDLACFRDHSASNRGVGDWLWKNVTELVIEPDGIVDLARDKLEEWLGGKVEDAAVEGASWLGAKALMWAVESQLTAEQGLYRWRKGEAMAASDRCPAGDKRLDELADGRKPALVFIHGTGSHTLGSFGELPGSSAWGELQDHFGEHVYGLEHRTFSESPIDNALLLLAALPVGARVSVVTHSRGGLVGDLLCLDYASKDLDALIKQYVRKPRPEELAAESGSPALRKQREAVSAGEQKKLKALVAALKSKQLVVERYVRVACPARGTALLSDNLDVFLSGLLTLVRKFGAWSTGAVAGLVATPLAAGTAKAVADRWLKFLTRVVLEIAQKRLQPQLVPGIEAMLPEAPMGMFLGRAPSCKLAMAVVAGDIEGGGLLGRIGVMFTDWAFFDRMDNDLVVDTASMYAGVARSASARAIFVQGAEVNHFRYFRDATATGGTPLPMAMQRWLLEQRPDALGDWKALPESYPRAVSRGEAQRTNSVGKNTRPVVVYLPGIMGSCLWVGNNAKDNVWLDFDDIIAGGLEKISIDQPVTAKGVVDLAYGDLEEHLFARYYVETYAYDWRQPIAELGKAFAEKLLTILAEHPDQPVRILAHSMGGLVVRAALARDSGSGETLLVDRFFSHRPGSRLIMLGTPNHGSHLMVQTLFGLSETIRLLARIDVSHELPEVLKIVGRFDGAINLLPAPDFVDTGDYAGERFYDAAEWERLGALNDDFWFGQDLCGRPSQAALDGTKAFWSAVADTAWVGRHADRIAYVFGHAEATPCGLKEMKDGDGRSLGLLVADTPDGDGSVTWQSGRLPGLPDENCWLMEADHMGLTSTRKYFGEIEALLEGRTPALKRLPVSRGDAAKAAVRTSRAGPPPAWPTREEAVASLLGGRPPRPRATLGREPLKVAVKAMDLRFQQVPVICGHYVKDPISGAEAVIDRELVRGALSQRQQMGIHSGNLGDATVVLMPRSREERLRGTGCGAVVVGLGEMGKLTAEGVSTAVRAGVLRFLLHASDRYGDELASNPGATLDNEALPLRLASLLIGSNSAAQLEVGEAVRAVVLGVLHANRDFAAARGKISGAFIEQLDLVEVYLDAAISAAYAVSQLESSLAWELQRLGARIVADGRLQRTDSARHRLNATPFGDYWPRLEVTDAERNSQACGPECYTPQLRNPIPPAAMKGLLKLYGCDGKAENGALSAVLEPAPEIRMAENMRFAFLGERARAEVVLQQRQPGLVEQLVADALSGPGSTAYIPGQSFGSNLFQLLVPLEFKDLARKLANLILLVDESTAALPWEMLEADGAPLVIKTRVVRQFYSARFRRDVIRADGMVACVVSNPSTEGYHAQFGGPNWKPQTGLDGKPVPDRLPELPGAAREGEAITRVLEAAGYRVDAVAPGARACDVMKVLLSGQSYRVLVIDAHGVFGKRAADGRFRSGVVLSDGLLLTAAEVSQMEKVPDLVFLNCCHLAKAGIGSGGNRLAAGLARELIEMGVRCVVAAGWEVRDDAARVFAETFFEQLVGRGESFGAAVHAARQAAYDNHPDCNTWGAYQAYGDPTFRLAQNIPELRDDESLAAAEELVDWLVQRRLDTRTRNPKARQLSAVRRRINQRLKSVPESWRGRADVQFALGELYGAFGGEGFDEARQAYLAAIVAASSSGVAPLKAVEQLANLEARSAEKLLGRAFTTKKEHEEAQAEALDRVDRAIDRLGYLLKYFPAEAVAAGPNAERYSLFGSACKTKAIVLRASGKGWAELEPWLKKAREAYAQGEGDPSAPGFNPYAMINRLQLDALLGSLQPNHAELVAQCQIAARRRFSTSFDFWDGVMATDATLAAWLAESELKPAAVAELAASVAAAYRSEVEKLVPEPREFDSVVRQIELLADFFGERPKKDAGDALDKLRVEVLRQLADRLRGPAAGAAPSQPAVAVEKDEGGVPPKGGNGKKGGPKGKP